MTLILNLFQTLPLDRVEKMRGYKKASRGSGGLGHNPIEGVQPISRFPSAQTGHRDSKLSFPNPMFDFDNEHVLICGKSCPHVFDTFRRDEKTVLF